MPIRGTAPVIRVPQPGSAGPRTFAVLQLSATNSASPLAAGTYTVPWDTVAQDTGGYTGVVANGFTVPQAGQYALGSWVNYTYNGAVVGWAQWKIMIMSGSTVIAAGGAGQQVTAPGPANLWEMQANAETAVVLPAGAALTVSAVLEYSGWFVGIDTSVMAYFYIGAF